MKIRNIFFFGILLVMAAVLFSSCESDYHWERASLVYTTRDSSVDPVINPMDGKIRIKLFMDWDHLPTRADRVALFNSKFILWSDFFRPGDAFRIYIETRRGIRYNDRMAVSSDRDGIFGIIDSNNLDYAMFMEDVLYELEEFGNVDLYIDIATNISDSKVLPVEFKFVNNLDIRVWR